jgi:hypothetical protein
MASHSAALTSLCACLRGTLPAHIDWIFLVGLANETLTTPALIDFVRQFEQQIPEDVCAYVRDIHQRNVARNDRLAAQLEEAVVAINARGVTPVLLKGAANLATVSGARRGTRLMADLDIMVAPDQVDAALGALADLDYEMHFETAPENEKWFAELKRPHDVGMIDLHRSAPGPAYFYRSVGHILKHCRLLSVGRGSVYVPTATYQALILIIHDQFQDYDYWLGRIDLRHLIELRDLANSPEGIDWDQLVSFAPGNLARNAVESQLVALAELLGVEVPIRLSSRFIPRFQFRRQLTQARFPVTRWPLLTSAVLDYGNYRRGPGAEKRTGGRLIGQSWAMPKFSTLRFILRLAKEHPVGKA